MNQKENAIADNLREIREQRNLSLDQLAELTGVSKSMLRQVETGRSSPTIATVWKIANGLRLSFTTLVSKRLPDVAIMDFAGASPMTAESGNYRLFPLMPFDPEHGFEIYYVEMEPGTTYAGEPHKGNVEEYVFVMKGNLHIAVEEALHEVKANQLIRFVADRPHTYRSTGKEAVSAIMMICYLG